MGATPAFSIIVPVFNVDEYLCEALNSLCAQSFDDFEVLLIDDGSTDDSGAICDEYARKDSRFIVNHQKNSGVSIARNVGISQALGEYLYFFDADDRLDLAALESWYMIFKEQDVDAVFFEGQSFSEEADLHASAYQYCRGLNGSERKVKSAPYIGDELERGHHMSTTCCYVFKQSFLGGVVFKPDIIHEDELFYIQIFVINNINLYVDKNVYYHRRLRSGSIMSSPKTDKNFYSYLSVYKSAIEELNVSVTGDQKKSLSTFLSYILYAMASMSLRIDGSPVSWAKRKLIIMSVIRHRAFRLFGLKYIFVAFFPEILIFKGDKSE
jgi:glycosyltransferase involved in cell wall biosynthesis